MRASVLFASLFAFAIILSASPSRCQCKRYANKLQTIKNRPTRAADLLVIVVLRLLLTLYQADMDLRQIDRKLSPQCMLIVLPAFGGQS